MDLTKLEDARTQLEEAEKALRDSARATLKEAVTNLLSDDNVTNVLWAQKSGEYNDEGMYPGIAGPHLNVGGANHGSFDPYDLDDRWDLMDTYGFTLDSRAEELDKVLKLLGEEVLSEIFGEECMVLAYKGENGQVKFESEYAGC